MQRVVGLLAAVLVTALFLLPSAASATHVCTTVVSFEPDTTDGHCPNQATGSYSFASLTQGASGTFARVRPTWQVPAMPAATYGGQWAAKVTRLAGGVDSVSGNRTLTPSWGADADVIYQMKFYLPYGALAKLPSTGIYLMRWETPPPPGHQIPTQCGGVILKPNGAQGRLDLVYQSQCQTAGVTLLSSTTPVRELEWIPVWVNQKLSTAANGCPSFPFPTCGGAYTAATLGNEPIRFKGLPNWGGTAATKFSYGLISTGASSATAEDLSVFEDCLGVGDSCAQEFPVRAAFYDPRFPEQWGTGGANSKYKPTPVAPEQVSHYSLDIPTSTPPPTEPIQAQIKAMQYAGIQAGIVRWQPQSPTESDTRFIRLLREAKHATGGFRWAMHYTKEEEEQSNPPATVIAQDIQALNTVNSDLGNVRAFDHSNYLQAERKPVIFVSANSSDLNTTAGCDMVRRWEGASSNYYVVMPSFPGHLDCTGVTYKPQSWQNFSAFAPSASVPKANPALAPFSYSISPGFQKTSETGARLPRDYLRWAKNVREMVASKADWQLVPFNHWLEGAAIESSKQWTSPAGTGFFLDTLHGDGDEQALPDIVVAAGDIACGPFDPNTTNCHQMDTSDLFVDPNPGATPPWKVKPGVEAVLTLGDNQYFCGSYAPEDPTIDEFNAPGAFNATWGRVKSKIKPSPGNHEYILREEPPDDLRCPGTGKGYFDYFLGINAPGMPGQAPAGARGEGWYSFNLGTDWHLISLNSPLCEVPNTGREFCETGAQGNWLATDLASLGSPPGRDCILAYWHHARYDSWRRIHPAHGGNDGNVKPFWDKLTADPVKADLVLNGHQHLYESFPKQSGEINNPVRADGMREIIVGTGGKAIFTEYPDEDPLLGRTHFPTSETYPHGVNTYGILQLAMYDRPATGGHGSYSWQFVPESRLYATPVAPGTVFQDSGADTCN